MENSIWGCPTCGQELHVASGLDLFCSAECRKKYYYDGKCSMCKKEYDNKDGWKIPNYMTYSDTQTLCPKCIIELENIKNKKEELTQQINHLKNSIKESNTEVYLKDDEYFFKSRDWDISLTEFKNAILDYENHKEEIESIEEFNRNVWRQINILQKELYDIVFTEAK